MYVESKYLFSDEQSLTATAASTNTIDFSSDRDVGRGEPMAAVVTVDTALAGTTPTFKVTIQTDDNTSFSSATDLVVSQEFSAAAAGDRIVVPLPLSNERYVRLNYTLGGTSPTITVTADLKPMAMVASEDVTYAGSYTVG